MTDDPTETAALRAAVHQLSIDVAAVHQLSIDVATLTVVMADLKVTVDNQVSRDRFDAVAFRVAEIEAWQTWTLRIVIGIVIVALVGLIMRTGGTP